MFDKIEALRKEPKQVRNRYAFWAAVCITFAITLVWALTLPARFAQEEIPKEVVEVQEVSPWANIRSWIEESVISPIGKVFNKSPNVTEIADEGASSIITLDLEALVASSTPQKPQEPVSTTSTSTPVF